MKEKSRFLAIALYFPLFTNALYLFVPVEVVILNYLNVLVFFGIVLGTARKESATPRQRWLTMLIRFSALFVGVGVLNHFIRGSGSLYFLARHYGFFISTGLLLYLSWMEEESLPPLYDKLVRLIGIIFLSQLLLSVVESLASKSVILESYDWNTTSIGRSDVIAAELSDRLQIGMIFENFRIPFKIPFSGMLGQHNHWGTQLPLYNLLFLLQALARPKERKFFIVLCCCVGFAILFNTSRFGILAVMITSIIVLLRYVQMPKGVKYALVLLPVGLVIYYLDDIIDALTLYFSLTDTFTLRWENWSTLWPYVWNRTPFSVLFGSPDQEIALIRAQLDWPDFESLFFQVVFEQGMVVLICFLGLLVYLWVKSGKNASLERLFTRLLVVNVILVSLWSNTLFRYSNYVFVALLVFRLFTARLIPAEAGVSSDKTAVGT